MHKQTYMTQSLARITTLAAWWLLTLALSVAHAESDVQVEHVTRSPLGTFRIEEERGKGTGKMEGAWITTAWIIPTTGPSKRVALVEPFDDTMGRTFFISPDERWICATVHFHSQLDGVMLYRRKAGFQFELVTTDETEAVDQSPTGTLTRAMALQIPHPIGMTLLECMIISSAGAQTRRGFSWKK
jgi:hypothetical protein